MFWVFFFLLSGPQEGTLHLSCIEGEASNHRTTREVSDLSYFEGYQVPFTEHYICEIHSCNCSCILQTFKTVQHSLIYDIQFVCSYKQAFELFAA